MAIKNRKYTRKNNKSRTRRRSHVKRGGSQRHQNDKNLNLAYRLLGRGQYDNVEGFSKHLNDYLKSNEDKASDDYTKIEQINDLLMKGHKKMTKGFDEFQELMDDDN